MTQQSARELQEQATQACEACDKAKTPASRATKARLIALHHFFQVCIRAYVASSFQADTGSVARCDAVACCVGNCATPTQPCSCQCTRIAPHVHVRALCLLCG